MLTFREFLADAAEKGEVINTVYEERLFELTGVLHRISEALTSARIPHELIGGMAVFVYVEEVDPAQAALTRDVDLMVHREDLERIKEAATRGGFRYRHTAGLDMSLYGETNSARNAVHLIFSGEKVAPKQAIPNPSFAPAKKQVQGVEISIIPIADLVRLKLSSFRLKDQLHVQVMDSAGLITPDVETHLSPKLNVRLQQLRASE